MADLAAAGWAVDVAVSGRPRQGSLGASGPW